MRSLSNATTFFFKQLPIFDVRTRILLWSTWNSDPIIPICVVGSRQYASLVSSTVHSSIDGTLPFVFWRLMVSPVQTLYSLFSIGSLLDFFVISFFLTLQSVQTYTYCISSFVICVSLTFHTKRKSSIWVVSLPLLRSFDSVFAAWCFTPARCMTSKSSSDNLDRHRPNLPEGSIKLMIYLIEFWFVLTVNHIFSTYDSCSKPPTQPRKILVA